MPPSVVCHWVARNAQRLLPCHAVAAGLARPQNLHAVCMGALASLPQSNPPACAHSSTWGSLQAFTTSAAPAAAAKAQEQESAPCTPNAAALSSDDMLWQLQQLQPVIRRYPKYNFTGVSVQAPSQPVPSPPCTIGSGKAALGEDLLNAGQLQRQGSTANRAHVTMSAADQRPVPHLGTVAADLGTPSSTDNSSSSSSSSGSSSSGSSSSSSSGSSATSNGSTKSSQQQQRPSNPLADVLGSQLAQAAGKRLTPRAIMAALDKHIVGQQGAKRAVAIALRNRWRRHQLPAEARSEVAPKNILMAGPTGCGKTEIARRLAKLVDAPFIKVEATKFTELGYVGRDVEDIIKDLVEASLTVTKARLKEALSSHVAAATEDALLDALLGPSALPTSRDTFREMLRSGAFESQGVSLPSSILGDAGGPASMEAAMQRVMEQMRGGRPSGAPQGAARGSEIPVSEARKVIQDKEAERLLSSDLVVKEALRAAAEDGIVFIDEIDKIVDSQRGSVSTSANVSNEGVQRDLLPILEGCQVTTKLGTISTDHILFICSGAFHSAKPSDMLAELQGRLPIRVELAALTQEDFYRILTEPQHNMIEQQQLLLATEGVDLRFTDAAVHALAHVAEEANRLLDNIGARRLHTVLERVLSDISFHAPERVAAARQAGQEEPLVYEVDAPQVETAVADLLKHHDLSRYML